MGQTEKDFTAGAGSLYLAVIGADGLPDDDGLRYLGDSESFSMNLTSETLEAMTGDDQVRQKVISVATSIERLGSMVLNEVREENLGLLVFGEVSDFEQDNTPVEDEAITASAKADHYYSLGVTAANPAGAKDVTAVTLDDGDTTTYEEGTDYELDAANGRFLVIAGGAAVGEIIEANYTPADSDYRQVQTQEDDNPEFWLEYRENARSGKNRDFIMPRVKVRPDGDASLKDADSHQQIPLQVDALVPNNGAPVLQIIRRDAS